VTKITFYIVFGIEFVSIGVFLAVITNWIFKHEMKLMLDRVFKNFEDKECENE